MGFLELRQDPGVYSRVTAGVSILNSSLFIEVRILSRYEGQLRIGDQSSPGRGWAPGVGCLGGRVKWIPLPAPLLPRS